MTEPLDPTIAAARHALGLLSLDHDLLKDPVSLPVLDVDQAAWVLLELHIGSIAHGRAEPEAGMHLVIEEVFRPAFLGRASGRRHYDSYDIDRLLAFQDSYDDIRRAEERNGVRDLRREQTDAQVILSAKEWMHRNATGRVY